MESENIRTVRRVYELYTALPPDRAEGAASAELAELMALFSEDVEMVEVPGMIWRTGAERGRRALNRSWAEWRAAWPTTRSEIESIEERGERILVLSHERLESNEGLAIESRGGGVYTLRDGRIVRVEMHLTHEDARAAFEGG